MPRLVLDEPSAPAISPGALNPIPQRKAPKLVLDATEIPEFTTAIPVNEDQSSSLKSVGEKIRGLSKTIPLPIAGFPLEKVSPEFFDKFAPIKTRTEIRQARNPLIPMTDDEFKKQASDINSYFLKRYPTNYYSGTPHYIESFAHGILPVNQEIKENPDIVKEHPISNMLGKLTGYILAGRVTAPLAADLKGKVEWISPMFPYLARAIPLVTERAVLFGGKAVLDQVAKMISGQGASWKDVGDIAESTAFGALTGGVSSVGKTIPRIAGQTLFGGAWQAGRTLLEKHKIAKEDLSAIGLSAVLNGLVEAFHAPQVTKAYKLRELEAWNKSAAVTRIMRTHPEYTKEDAKMASILIDTFAMKVKPPSISVIAKVLPDNFHKLPNTLKAKIIESSVRAVTNGWSVSQVAEVLKNGQLGLLSSEGYGQLVADQIQKQFESSPQQAPAIVPSPQESVSPIASPAPGPKLVPDNAGQPIILPPHLQKIADKAKGLTSEEAKNEQIKTPEEKVAPIQNIEKPVIGIPIFKNSEEAVAFGKNSDQKTLDALKEAAIEHKKNYDLLMDSGKESEAANLLYGQKQFVNEAIKEAEANNKNLKAFSDEDIKDFQDISNLMGYTEPSQLIKTDEGYTRLAGGAPANFLKGETNKNIDRILYKIKNGIQLAPKQEEKFKELLDGYRKEIKSIDKEFENAKSEIPESEASEIIRSADQAEPSDKQSIQKAIEGWGDEEEPSKESKLTPSGQIRPELQSPIQSELFQQPGELFEKIEPENKNIARTKESDILSFGSEENAKKAIEEAIGKISGESQDRIEPGRTSAALLREVAKSKNELVRQLKERGFVDYRGYVIDSVESVATAARLFRNPKVEQFQVIYLKGNKIVAHRVISSGKPNYVDFGYKFMYEISSAAKRLGADSIYFAHNHPSGDITPSDQDIGIVLMTVKDEKLNLPVVGHIVTDGGEYSFINSQGKKSKHSFLAPEKNYTTTAGAISNVGEAALAARNFVKFPKPTMLFLDSKNRVIGIDTVKDISNISKYLANAKSFYGSSYYIVLIPEKLATPTNLPSGLLDIIKIDNEGNAVSSMAERGTIHSYTLRPINKKEERYYGVQESTGEESQTPPKLPKKEIPPEQLPHSGADVPELVRMAKELTGKDVELGRLITNLGLFKGFEGIELNPKIFKNPYLVASVLAHEIGHLIDWLPDHILSRGGLLNRLLSLRNYIRETANPGDKWTPEENKLRREEYKRRAGLVGNIKSKEFTEELMALASWHRGFDFKKAGPKYNSAAELYAEALSVMLTKPEEFAARAPKFSKAFWANIDAKPEAKQALIDLDELLGGKDKNIVDELDKDIRRMFAKGDELRKQKLAERKIAKVSSYERIRQLIDDKYHQIIKKQENLEKQGVLFPPDQNPKYLLEENSLSDNAIYEWCMEVDKQITKELDAAELSEADLGVYTFLKRIIGAPESSEEIVPFDDIDIEELDGMVDASTGETFKSSEMFKDRKEIANPLGLYPKRAQTQLDKLKASIGEEKYARLEKIADKFHKLVFSVVEDAVKVGSYNKKVFEDKILPNKDTYVAFGVLNYLQNYVPAGVKKQAGTLSEIENPFITTVLKTISLIKLNEKQKTVNSVRDMLLKYFPEEIAPTKSIKPKGVKVFVNPAPGKGQMKLLEDGKMASYDIDPYIAESLDRDSTSLSKDIGNIINTLFGNNIFRQLYITYNPGFAFAFNPIRDFKRAYKSLAALGHGVSVKDLLIEYIKNMPSAYKKLMGINDALIKEMIHNKALEVNIDDFADTYASKDKVFNDILIKYRLAKNPEELKGIRRTLLKPVAKFLEFIRFHGSALESISKIAGYNILKKQDVPPAERAYITRNFIGTPNWRKKGLASDTTNAVWMFSNIMKEGMKSDLFLASNPKTRSGYWWSTVKVDLLPKLLMGLAAAGIFGYGLKRFYDKVSEYDKTNYIIIPAGIAEDGKAQYFRIPHDETGRLISALFWKTTGALQGKPDQLQQIFSYGAGQIPNLAPGIQIGAGWLTYLQGKNPYDNFRGRYIIDDTTWKAGGAYALKKMIQWTINQSGLANFSTYDKDKNTTFESIVQFTPIINRIFRVSDYGEQELKNQKKAQRQKIMAQHHLQREEN